MNTVNQPALAIFPPLPQPPVLPLWGDGAPAHVPASAVDVDRRVCKALKCDQCGKRGLQFTPQHSGRRYRVLARCSRCGGEVEL